MPKRIQINQPGLTFYVDGKNISTPTTIRLTPNNRHIIEKQLVEHGLTGHELKGGRDVVVEPPLRATGLFKDDPDDRDFILTQSPLMSSLPNKSELPKKMDLSNWMSPVKDQGNLGSCVAFGCVAVKEYQQQKEYLKEIDEGSQYRRGEDHYNLSEQYLYYKTKEIDRWPNSEGTSIRYALKILRNKGVPPEKAWPYNDSKKGKPKVWSKMISKWAKSGNYFRINNLDELLKAVYKFGPIPIGIVCFEEIFNPGPDGVVPYPSNPARQYGGHCVPICGFNQETGYVRFKNSWGLSWGRDGYGFLPFDYIKDFMIDAWVPTDIEVTREMLKD